jgi:microcystin-dependent protein
MSNPFLAEIRAFPFNFPPKGWAFCDGQLLPISQNTALFSLLGTTYGGDGKSNFALPNLQGNITMHPGQGPGLSLHDLGETGGSDTVTLLESEIPSHSHQLKADKVRGPDNTAPTLAATSFGAAVGIYSNATTPIANFSDSAIAPAGGDQPHNNLMPYLTLNFCIAMQGVYPPRT